MPHNIFSNFEFNAITSLAGQIWLQTHYHNCWQSMHQCLQTQTLMPYATHLKTLQSHHQLLNCPQNSNVASSPAIPQMIKLHWSFQRSVTPPKKTMMPGCHIILRVTCSTNGKQHRTGTMSDCTSQESWHMTSLNKSTIKVATRGLNDVWRDYDTSRYIKVHISWNNT